MRRGLVGMDIRVPRQPRVFARFMGGRIIDDHVYVFSLMLLHDAVHEVQKLPSAAFVVLSGNLTADHISAVNRLFRW